MANKLINVEAFKLGVESKLGQRRKLAQFVEQEFVEDLQASTVNITTNDYVGDATVIKAGAKIPVSDLVQTKTPVTFEKIAKGVKVTDEELNQTFGDALGNAENQTVLAIDGAMETKVAELVKEAKFKIKATAINTDAVLSAMGAMGEALEDEETFLVVNPVDYAKLQKELKGSDNTVANGSVYGNTLVMSAKIAEGDAILVQKGAIKEIIQKDTDVEPSRLASEKSTEIFTDKIHAVYIQDQSKLVYLGKTVV